MDETKYVRTHARTSLFTHIQCGRWACCREKKSREKNTLSLQDGCKSWRKESPVTALNTKPSPWRPEGSGCKIKIKPVALPLGIIARAWKNNLVEIERTDCKAFIFHFYCLLNYCWGTHWKQGASRLIYPIALSFWWRVFILAVDYLFHKVEI